MHQGSDETTSSSAAEESGRRRAIGLLWSVAAVALVVAILGGLKGWAHGLSTARASAKYQVDGYVQWGEFWACVINAGLAAILAVLLQKTSWGRDPDGANGVEEGARAPRPLTRWTWLGLLLLLVAGGALRWQRMGLSLYNDEAHTFRRYIAGHFSETSTGKVKWHPVTWLDTLWLDQVGNNSTPCSLLGRLGYDAWRKLTHAPEGAMSEPSIRLQAWLGGMGSLIFLWLLGRRWLPRGGEWWLLALACFHPWHVRYSTEARGYGLLLLGVVAGCYFLVRALENQRWRWWLGLGLAQFLCVWSFPGIIYWLAVFQAFVWTLFLGRHLRGQGCLWGWQRSVVGSAVGGMLALQWLLPIAPQLMGALKVLNSMKGAMGLAWWQDALGGLGFGLRWIDADPANPNNLTISRLLERHPTLGWVIIAVVALIFALGLARLTRRDGAGIVIALSGPVAVMLSWAAMRAQEKFLHSWYIIYALPGILIAWTVAVIDFRKLMGRTAAAVALVAAVAPWWWQADALFSRHSKEDIQGVGREIQKLEQERGRPFVVATFYSDVDVYVHPIRVVNSVEEIQALAKKAAAGGSGFCVTLGRKPLLAKDHPEILRLLENKQDYEALPPVRGLEEEQFTHWIYVKKALAPVKST